MNTFRKTLIILFLYSIVSYCQPYIYFTTTIPGSGSNLNVDRIDLSSGQTERIWDSVFVSEIRWDDSQNWIFINQKFSGWVTFNSNDFHHSLLLPSDIMGIGGILNCRICNKIYFFSTSDFLNRESLNVVDVNTSQVEKLLDIPFNYNMNNYLNEEAFFSYDSTMIYFVVEDSLSGIPNVGCFSTTSKSIIKYLPLSIYGHPNAKYYILHKGYRGNSIIESYLNDSTYYNLYNFDNELSAPYVKYKGDSNVYLLKDSLILVEETLFDTTNVKFQATGNYLLYNGLDAKFISSLSLLPNGKIYWFNNYQNKLYCYGNEDNTLISINIDSLLYPKSKNFLVKLQNSSGSLIPGGSLQYYDGGWKDAENNGDGTFEVNTEKSKVSLRINYEHGSQTVSNIPAQNNTFAFHTVNANVQLRNSRGELMDSAQIQYYAGGWRNLGTTSGGIAMKELLPGNYTFRSHYAYGSSDKKQDIGLDSIVVFKTVNANVELQNSLGNLIDEGTVQYYAGGWRAFGTTLNGTATKELLPGNYSFRMRYAYASSDKKQNIGSDSVVIFKTINTNVELLNSLGNLIDEGTVQYYSGGWRAFGTTLNGTATKELLPGNYSFRMHYAYGSNDRKQNISVDSVVIFRTVNAGVHLENSLGVLIDQGKVQYYAGGWRDFGTTENGVTTKELLPNNYSFRMKYANASNDKKQNIGVDSVVIFKTVNANVQLQNSSGNLIDEGTVQYYAGGWRDFGTTANGIATKELLPNNYNFRMRYAYSSIDKKQNITIDSVVIFKTVNTVVKLQTSKGEPIDQGTVQYYAGGWRNFGTTSGGAATKELLPGNYSFRMTREYISSDKKQDIASNNIIVFSTVLCKINVTNSQNQPVNGADIKYYSGGWRDIGQTVNGQIIKELLPKNITFRMIYNSIRLDKTQDISSNSVVNFNTGVQ